MRASGRTSRRFAISFFALVLTVPVRSQRQRPSSLPTATPKTRQESASEGGYVGSRACAKCHPSIYESFMRTDMGHSMSEITPALLATVPATANIFDPRLNRHFELSIRDGSLFQSEYETAADGKEVFRDTRKVQWIIGSGANGRGAIVQDGDFLFEAPLSLYTKPEKWALSPGYEFGDYGFNRPILPGCIACHSGQPRPVLDGNGRFQQPAFAELSIGCENCHGPGEAHVAAAEMGSPLGSIQNPAKLSHWLADNICMSCHQIGDARVLQAGKNYRDFRSGAELDDTLSIFLVPFRRESAPKDDLLEHYLSMRLSKCYLKSEGRLSCITCHDPHVQPSMPEAPGYFRQKCLICHTDKSCALPLSLRQHKTPANDCAGCHMPKRQVTVISHSVLTNHRIVAQAEEPFPDAAFRMISSQLPDLVHLSANPGRQQAASQFVLLQAYAQVVLAHPEYRTRYWSLAQQLKSTDGDNVYVLEALADEAVQKHTPEGSSLAIAYLQNAIRHGATSPSDFEELAELLIGGNRHVEAIEVLHHAIQLGPYEARFYKLTAKIYFDRHQTQNACEVVAKGSKSCPQDDALRSLLEQCSGKLSK